MPFYRNISPLKQLILLLIILILPSCLRKAHESGHKKILNIAISNEIPTFDPALAYDTVSASVIQQCYETLFEYHYLKRPYTLKPLLAEEMPLVLNNSKKYIIKIKNNIRYHDDPAFQGKPRFVTAQDFITQIKRLAFRPTQSNGWWLFDNKIIGITQFRQEAGDDLNKFFKLNIAGLTAPDAHTLVIDLVEPFPELIYALAMTFTSPIPEEIVRHYNNKLSNLMIGTGPFQFISWKDDRTLIMNKFIHYHPEFYPGQGDRKSIVMGLTEDAGKRLPFIDVIQFHIIQDVETRWEQFLKKQIDFLLIPKDYFNTAIDSNGNLSSNLRDKKIQLQIAPTLTYWWLSFNMNDKILGHNIYLRKAIAHAIDIDTYIQKFTNNIGLKANSIYPPGIPGYNPSFKLPYSYNIEKAKQFLAKAGYPNGENLPPLRFDIRGNNTTTHQQAEFIKKNLEKININVTIIFNSFKEFLKKSHVGQLQFWQDGWNLDYPDAENIIQLLITQNHPPGPNSTFYSNPDIDRLFAQLKFTTNQDDKVKIMQKIESIVHQDLPWIMEYYARNYILFHNYLKNYRHSDMITNFVKYLRIED